MEEASNDVEELEKSASRETWGPGAAAGGAIERYTELLLLQLRALNPEASLMWVTAAWRDFGSGEDVLPPYHNDATVRIRVARGGGLCVRACACMCVCVCACVCVCVGPPAHAAA